MSETWVPVENGWHGHVKIDDEFIGIDDRDSDGLKTYIVTDLPSDVRLCRRVDAPAEPSMSDIRIALALAWERIETSLQSDQTVDAMQRLQSWLAVCGEK